MPPPQLRVPGRRPCAARRRRPATGGRLVQARGPRGGGHARRRPPQRARRRLPGARGRPHGTRPRPGGRRLAHAPHRPGPAHLPPGGVAPPGASQGAWARRTSRPVPQPDRDPTPRPRTTSCGTPRASSGPPRPRPCPGASRRRCPARWSRRISRTRRPRRGVPRPCDGRR